MDLSVWVAYFITTIVLSLYLGIVTWRAAPRTFASFRRAASIAAS